MERPVAERYSRLLGLVGLLLAAEPLGRWVCRGNEPCVVLDPFAGSGTTLLVALRLGCRAIGIEINPEYAEIARRRIRVEAEQVRSC